MQNKPFLIIAMDGGAASGKSTTSRALAKELNLLHVDTGCHYRAITWYLIQQGLNLSLEKSVVAFLKNLHLSNLIENRTAHIYIDNKRIDDEILRSNEVNARVSTISAIPGVRQFLFDFQRSYKNIAQNKGFEGLVMEGRDISTVIFPEADFKFFLEADVETRMKRRAAEGRVDPIVKRDQADSTRKSAPFTCPEGATRIDTSHLSFNEVVATVSGIIKTHLETSVQ